MKMTLSNRLLAFPMWLLFAGTTFIGLLVGRIVSTKAAVLGDELYVKGNRVAPETVERIIVEVYWPYADYTLKPRDRRRVSLWPEGRLDFFGSNLYAWAKKRSVPLDFEGFPWAIEAMEKRFTSRR